VLLPFPGAVAEEGGSMNVRLVYEVLAFLLRHYIATQPVSNQAGTEQANELLERIEDARTNEVSREEEAERVLLRKIGL